MPFTPEMRRGIDEIRDYLYGGGYPDPVSNAEQLSFLIFFSISLRGWIRTTPTAHGRRSGPMPAFLRANPGR